MMATLYCMYGTCCTLAAFDFRTSDRQPRTRSRAKSTSSATRCMALSAVPQGTVKNGFSNTYEPPHCVVHSGVEPPHRRHTAPRALCCASARLRRQPQAWY